MEEVMSMYDEKVVVANENLAALADVTAPSTGLVTGISQGGDLIQVYWEVYNPLIGDLFLDGDNAGELFCFHIVFGQIKGSRKLMCEVPTDGGKIALIGNGGHISTVADIYTRDLEFSELAKYKRKGRDPKLLLAVASQLDTEMTLHLCMSAMGNTYDSKKEVSIETLYEHNVVLRHHDLGLGYCISDYCDKPFLVPLRGTAEEIYKAYLSALLLKHMQGAAVAVKCTPRGEKPSIITSVK